MEEGAEKQEAPLSRKTDNLAKKDEFSSEASSFEKRLFEAGTLEFDLEEHLGEARERLESSRNWFDITLAGMRKEQQRVWLGSTGMYTMD